MGDRYATILTRCLAFESKAHRDAVLAEYSPQVQRMVRKLMERLAHRLATRVRYAGVGAMVREDGYRRPINAAERRERRREAVAAIEPGWLRRRVTVMVHEQFQMVRDYRRQLRAQVEDAA